LNLNEINHIVGVILNLKRGELRLKNGQERSAVLGQAAGGGQELRAAKKVTVEAKEGVGTCAKRSLKGVVT
jgi:hypothetical protein